MTRLSAARAMAPPHRTPLRSEAEDAVDSIALGFVQRRPRRAAVPLGGGCLVAPRQEGLPAFENASLAIERCAQTMICAMSAVGGRPHDATAEGPSTPRHQFPGGSRLHARSRQQ